MPEHMRRLFSQEVGEIVLFGFVCPLLGVGLIALGVGAVAASTGSNGAGDFVIVFGFIAGLILIVGGMAFAAETLEELRSSNGNGYHVGMRG